MASTGIYRDIQKRTGGDIYIERFFHGWGDRCDLSDLSLEYKSASIFMYGQR